MRLVDSHCHLDTLNLSQDEDLNSVLERAKTAGVNYFLCVCITQAQFMSMQKKVEDYSNIFLSVGTHPNEVLATEPDYDEMVRFAKLPNVVAIGETGLDYFRTEGDTKWQEERFRKHIQAAKETRNPLIVHSRDAKIDTIRILNEEKADTVGGVLHCFTEDWEMAKQAMELNFYISFSGIVTFQNAKQLQEVAVQMPLDRILIETDSPYLAPVPFRGKSNEPAYVRYVAEKIAELKNVSLETIAHHSTENFFNLFEKARRL